ncbi:MAG: 4-(cytidine 5'-diphospho)-2-C-methyl-D-erythritol kinase [Desulfosarcinaceae bacterium]|nr:4-(cytidine 5'-diphospho)-2-C-methyl-D-erythritol kinase [Desulfosarcinaceae bacterium]
MSAPGTDLPRRSTAVSADASEMTPRTIAAPAKINLFLRVLGRRPDGYHEIESLFCPVGLYDHITLSPADGVQINCDAAHVPCDERNLAHRAAIRFLHALAESGQPPPLFLAKGVHIDLQKEIPVGAGLGGGSSDAAAVLKGLNAICGCPFDLDHLRRLALSLGADCPFFIDARPALATGIGEQLTIFHSLPKLYAIIIYPGIHTATADVYKKLKLGLTKQQKKISYFTFTGPEFDARRHLINDLETVTENDHPEIQTAKTDLRQSGALGVLMSGSGSSVFGLFHAESAARRALAALVLRRGWQVYLAPLLV